LANGASASVAIPNYGSNASETYFHEGVEVFKFAEDTVVDRALIMGFKNPNGLLSFSKYVEILKPDIVHFHEIAGSNGITIKHVEAASSFGAKVLFTFHLSSNTCSTGNLFYKDEDICDGIIDIKKCSICYTHSKAGPPILATASNLLYNLGINTTTWHNKLGTGLGTAFIVERKRENFNSLVKSCDKVISLTNWYKNILLSNKVPEQKISFIPQALPHLNLQKLIHRQNNFDGVVKLIFVGRISAFKGVHLLIDAVKNLPREKVTLHIYGQTDSAEYEQNLKQISNANSNIVWKGALLPANVLTTMQNYDVLCLCSTFSEMSPLVVQEAFAAGIPVLASNVYGNSEQIADGKNGWLFKFKDVADLKSKIEFLIENPTAIENAKQNIPLVNGFDKVVKAHLELYNSVLQQ
jgi:glycosyltransferase involved in cell wall biosynthesis